MDRQQHLEWAKQRAFSEIDRTSGLAGWISFRSDMGKHADLSNHVALEIGDGLVQIAMSGGIEGVRVLDLPGPFNMRAFIDGFF